MKAFAKVMAAAELSALLACTLVPAIALAETAAPDSASPEKPAKPEPAKVDPLGKTPVLSYTVRAVNSNKNISCSAGKAVTIKSGISKIFIKTPVSSVTKKPLSAKATYSLGYSGKKTETAAAANTWLGHKSSKTIAQSFSLNFSGDLAKKYNVYYRVKADRLGWLDWTKNGKKAGTSGKKLRIKGIQIKLVPVGAAAPGSTENAYLNEKPSVSYRAVTAEGSKTRFVRSSKTLGKKSYLAGMRSLEIKTVSPQMSGNVEYNVMTRKGTWTGWSSQGFAGGSSTGNQAQAVKIRLTGDLAKVYDVYYRTYSGDRHWLAWAKNGKKAGTAKIKYPLGALQAKLVLKGSKAPKNAKKATKSFIAEPFPNGMGEIATTRKAQKYSSATKWLILINSSACRTAVFKGSKGHWKLMKYMKCGVGKYTTPTVTGSFTVGMKRYSFGEERGYSCYYATQFYGNYMMHSGLFWPYTRKVRDGRLGIHISHGCVRLGIDDAKWVYDTIPYGSKVISYN